MNATDKKLAELKCPVCGSEDIVEWNDVPTRYEIVVELDENGQPDVTYTGEAEPVYEGLEITGYSCRNYCMEAPLENFIVNK